MFVFREDFEPAVFRQLRLDCLSASSADESDDDEGYIVFKYILYFFRDFDFHQLGSVY